MEKREQGSDGAGTHQRSTASQRPHHGRRRSKRQPHELLLPPATRQANHEMPVTKTRLEGHWEAQSSRDNHGRRAATNAHSSSTHWRREARAAEHRGERRDASTRRGGSGERPESMKTVVLECDGRRQQSPTPTDGDDDYLTLTVSYSVTLTPYPSPLKHSKTPAQTPPPSPGFAGRDRHHRRVPLLKHLKTPAQSPPPSPGFAGRDCHYRCVVSSPVRPFIHLSLAPSEAFPGSQRPRGPQAAIAVACSSAPPLRLRWPLPSSSLVFASSAPRVSCPLDSHPVSRVIQTFQEAQINFNDHRIQRRKACLLGFFIQFQSPPFSHPLPLLYLSFANPRCRNTPQTTPQPAFTAAQPASAAAAFCFRRCRARRCLNAWSLVNDYAFSIHGCLFFSSPSVVSLVRSSSQRNPNQSAKNLYGYAAEEALG
ncbi:hypothetical protein Ahy_B03g065762 [Arachis hypogaea]|uniref:PAS domain-containing protein n=1 Tax=Arachis hypogaea TaxID=3818 RepID=A0A445A2K2_ARAHY|nr:hypothetical protein Ahy_B03g065762 [Arachis hypogaea]